MACRCPGSRAVVEVRPRGVILLCSRGRSLRRPDVTEIASLAVFRAGGTLPTSLYGSIKSDQAKNYWGKRHQECHDGNDSFRGNAHVVE